MLEAWRRNWKIYLIEGWALGMFMISAAFFTILVESTDFPIREAIPSPIIRRFLIGIAMGLTAIALIYSKWGKRSGAHMNPAVTIAFLQLDRIRPIDATWYILFQFLGGYLGISIFKVFGMKYLAAPEVNYVVTMPGIQGIWVALLMEMLLSFSLFLTVLLVSNTSKWSGYTGIFAGALIVIFITFEAPFSGMSMNPARTVASAIPSHSWHGWWIYFLGPVIGMNLAGFIYRSIYRIRNNGNCLTMKCHMSGEKHDNTTYEVLGPKRFLEL